MAAGQRDEKPAFRDDDRQAPDDQMHGKGRLPSGILLVFVLLLAALGFRLLLRLPSGVLKTQGPNHPFAGTGLSNLSLSPLTGGGQPADLEGLEGRVTLVNYWGTWCPPCREEMPELVRLGKLLNDQPRFVMLLVSCGDSDVRVLKRDTEDYLKNQGWPALATYHDADYANRALLTQDTGVEVSYPTTIVLDGDGTIRGYWVGYAPGAVDQMQELVEELLEAFQ